MSDWQSIVTQIGDRYNLAYLALGNGTITQGTVDEFKRVLAMRPGLRVDRVQLLGKVISANITTTQSAPLTRIVGPFLYAGTPAIQFSLSNVVRLTPTTSTAQTTSTITAPRINDAYKSEPPKEVSGVCWVLGGDNGKFFGIPIPGCPTTPEGELTGVGKSIGTELSAILQPLIIPGIVVVAGIYFLGRAKA